MDTCGDRERNKDNSNPQGAFQNLCSNQLNSMGSTLSPFYRKEDGDWERVSDLPRVTQPACDVEEVFKFQNFRIRRDLGS